MEGDHHNAKAMQKLHISIHALRVEGDRAHLSRNTAKILEFLSTPSGWRATLYGGAQIVAADRISIHALRVEGDDRKFCREYFIGMISIHALRVEGDP